MGNFEIQDPPVFQVEITKWSRETNADGDEMGRDMEKVFNNTIYNKAMIERERNVTEVLLTAVDWQEENGLYIQTISVPGAEEDMDPVLYSALADEADAEARKAYKKAFGIISSGSGIVRAGTATFKVDKKPATDCMVGLRGV